MLVLKRRVGGARMPTAPTRFARAAAKNWAWAFKNFEYVDGKVRPPRLPDTSTTSRDMRVVDLDLLREALRGMEPDLVGAMLWAIISSLVGEDSNRGACVVSRCRQLRQFPGGEAVPSGCVRRGSDSRNSGLRFVGACSGRHYGGRNEDS